MRLFYFFPVKNDKVYFSSYEGKQFSCNPKYVYLKLRHLNEELDYIYEYNDSGNVPIELENATIVKHNSIMYFFHVLTAKVIVSNNAMNPKLPIRHSQYVINTWHGGGAFKRVGIDIDSKVNGLDGKLLKITADQTSLFLASSKGFYEGTGKGSCIPYDKVLFVGMPRNDVLFCNPNEREIINRKVRDYYGISQSDKLLLYAPTFRGGIGFVERIKGEHLKWTEVKRSLGKRFGGEWKLVFRGHYHSTIGIDDVSVLIDASDYPDSQELLIASDAVITDYSSMIWDYSLTEKPGFLFCPDLNNYLNERNFYSPIESWPYHYAENNHDLCDIIEKYSEEDNRNRCTDYHLTMGSYEDGFASLAIAEVVKNHLCK